MLFRREISVIIHLPDCKIEGQVYLPAGRQISKILNPSRFSSNLVPVRQAKVYHWTSQMLKKNPVYQTDLLLVNSDYIIMINPLSKSHEKKE